MIILLSIISIALLVALSISIYGIFNLLRNSELLEEQYDAVLAHNVKLTKNIEHAYSIINEADIKGSFESDDEIGAAFETIKSTISDLKESV